MEDQGKSWNFNLFSLVICFCEDGRVSVETKFEASESPQYILFKLSAYKMGVSMRLFKLRFLSLFKLPFSISGENRSLNETFKREIWA